MLKTLRIHNFALVDKLEVDFASGLNILTGETGAGKSIIVGAINLILGERANQEMVRSGASSATIEGDFWLDNNININKLINSLDIPISSDTLNIRREISSKGNSRCFLNDRIITLANLKMIGDGLADLHGQHQHQALLDTNKHIEYLDSFGGLIELVEKVGDGFKSLKDKIEQLRILREQEKKDQERKELSVFQIEEIRKAGLEPDEEQKLLERKRVLENAEELHRLVSSVSAGLYEDDDSVAEKLSFHWDELKKAAELDNKLKEHLQNLESALIQVEETSRILSKYKESIDFDAGELEKIADRLDLINHLKKKYGQSVQEIFGYTRKIEQDLEKISSRAEDIRQKESEVEKLTAELKTQTILLSSKRKDRGVELSKRIQKELSYLGMEKTKFEVRISATLDEFGLLKVDGKKYYVDEKGMDRIEFFVCPNPGEELKPLAKIASGGEISRIMLALKVILSKMDHINTLVFDEIDVGIGGQVAQAVGGKLKSLACDCQVICITHLQQIASQADHHFKVFKEMSEKRMITKLKQLNSTERVEEIARLISGKKITPIALKQAAQMIEEGKSH